MATSLLGLDFEHFRTLIVDHYRATRVRWPGDAFNEPEHSASDSLPVDWIYPDILRSEATSFNVENEQGRDVRVVIYGAFQPERSGFVGRIDLIHADLLDALSLERTVNQNTFDDRFDYTGVSSPPPGMTLSHNWLWRAWFLDSTNFQQVA